MRREEPNVPSPSDARTVTLLVPTRNEAANIGEFIERVEAALAGVGYAWEVVFADDSDDETPDLVAELAARGHPVAIHHREPGDRAHSVTGALCAALSGLRSDVVAVIDGDLQHPPEVLPRLLGPVVSGAADFSIGTRYREGGSSEGLSGFWRRIGSRGSSLLTRVMFPSLFWCSDLASGLFAFDRSLVAGVDLRPRGLKILPEIIVRGSPLRVADVPYVFAVRSGGQSKATVRDGVTLLRHLLTLRLTTVRFSAAEVSVVPDGAQPEGETDGPASAPD